VLRLSLLLTDYGTGISCCPAQKVNDQGNDREYDQQMDERAGNMENNEAENPCDQQDNE
jgi:hypothetical protein